jgi:hypothetical protein
MMREDLMTPAHSHSSSFLDESFLYLQNRLLLLPYSGINLGPTPNVLIIQECVETAE